jgi:hypothetical protein
MDLTYVLLSELLSLVHLQYLTDRDTHGTGLKAETDFQAPVPAYKSPNHRQPLQEIDTCLLAVQESTWTSAAFGIVHYHRLILMKRD